MQPFNGLKNYYTNKLLYTNTFKVDPHAEVLDSNEEAYIEPEFIEECMLELDLSASEGLKQYNDSKAENVWEHYLAMLNSLEPDNIMNKGTCERNSYLNGKLSFDYAYASLLLPNQRPLL